MPFIYLNVQNKNYIFKPIRKQESIWTYKPKQSKQEFKDWLNNFEMPVLDFDYDKAYKEIFNDFAKFFPFDETEHWENVYFELLEENIEPLKPALKSWHDNLDKEMKTFYNNEGYNDDEFDDEYSKILGAMSMGEASYSLASDNFIRNFDNKSRKRLIIEKFCESILKSK